MLTALPLALLVALLAGRRVAGAIGSGPAAGYLLALSVASILAITLAPASPPVGPLEGPRCLVPTLGVLASGDLLRIDEESLNVLLFVPLGVAVAWVPPPSRPAVLGFGLVLPWLVEGIQLTLPALGRTCQAVDLTTNLLGLGLGLAAGLLARRLAVGGPAGPNKRP